MLLQRVRALRGNGNGSFTETSSGAVGYGPASLYMTRRRWDYFVRHLLGAEPPAGHRIELRRPPSL